VDEDWLERSPPVDEAIYCANESIARLVDSEAVMSRPARYLLGTIIVGILVLCLCGLALRRPPTADPFDKPAPAAGVH